MMYPTRPSGSVAETVRSERMWAGIAALLVSYYGFYVAARGTTAAEGILFYTLRIGGPALFLSVVLLQIGKPIALAFDAVVSILIGVGLVLSSLLWYARGGGGPQNFLNVIFGIIFASSGWRSWNLWMQLRPPSIPDARPIHESPAPLSMEPPQQQPRSTERPQPPSDSLAGRIKRHREGESAAPVHADDSPSPESAPPPATTTPDFTLESPAPIQPSTPTQSPAEVKPVNEVAEEVEQNDKPAQPKPESPPPPPTQGFLASFADSDNDKNQS